MKVAILAKLTTPDQNGILIHDELKRQGKDVRLGCYDWPFERIKKFVNTCHWIFLTGMSRQKPSQLKELKKKHKILIWSPDGNNIFTNNRDALWEQRKGIVDIIVSSTMSNTENFQGYAGKVVFMPQYHDTHFYPPQKRLDINKPIYDICFIGSTCRWSNARRLYLAELAKHYKVCYKGFMPELGISERCQGIAAARVYAQSKIAIGLPHDFPETRRYTTSDRIYKAMGCGAFYLMYQMPGLDEIFTIGKHLAIYKPSLIDLRKTIDYYLTQDSLRESIAAAGQLEIQRKHTLKIRARQYWDLMEQYEN